MNSITTQRIVTRMVAIGTSNCLTSKCLVNLVYRSVRLQRNNFYFGKTANQVNTNTSSMKVVQSHHDVSRCALYQHHSCLLKSFHTNCVMFSQRWFTVTWPRMARLDSADLRKRVDDLTDCFAEARELLGDARESLGSTYFSEDMMEAQEAVSSTVAKYQALLDELDDDQRKDVVRTIGLRMEELKAQEQAIKDLLD